MSFLLDRKLDHENRCEQAIRHGSAGDAVFHAAKAAEFAYALAEQTDGILAKRYIGDAEGWLEIAERLKKNPLKSRGSEDVDRKSERGNSTGDEAGEGGDAAADEWLVMSKPSVTFDQIAGMTDAKQTIREMAVYPLRQPEKARSLGLKPGGGVLLYGPPGNGKTMLGKAVASELDASFFYASGAQIRSKWHGESEQRLRKLIQTARQEAVSVLFFDEVEGLLPKRGGHSAVDNRIVTQFLAEIGGFEESDHVLLLLGATNCPWDIDAAAFRTGRFDEKIFIGLPDSPAREGILARHLGNVPAEEGLSIAQWAQRLDGYTGSDIVAIVNAAKRACLSRSVMDNTEPLLLLADLEDALHAIPSSVTPALMKKYDDFRERRF